jgi:hypothetical protein
MQGRVSWKEEEVYSFVLRYFGGPGPQESIGSLKRSIAKAFPNRSLIVSTASDSEDAKPWLHTAQHPSVVGRNSSKSVRLSSTTRQQSGSAARTAATPLRMAVGVLGFFCVVIVSIR